ncbi:MAG TPA: hypothetical protein VKV74_07330 [Bryobacteraceae bacterium]|nr:hypothetical protein [Bryobacteraceae bacterium]
MKTLLALLLVPLAAPGQAPAPSIAAPWDIDKIIADFSAAASRIQPVLDQLTPQQWVQNGAPAAYVAQWQSARQEMDYLANSAQAFAGQPGRLTRALDAYFRWEALQARLNTLLEGVRKYQNPAIGDLLVSLLSQNASNHDQLRQYITDLASQKEEESAILDQEAQRCRGILNRQTGPAPKNPPAKPPLKHSEDKP